MSEGKDFYKPQILKQQTVAQLTWTINSNKYNTLKVPWKEQSNTI